LPAVFAVADFHHAGVTQHFHLATHAVKVAPIAAAIWLMERVRPSASIFTMGQRDSLPKAKSTETDQAWARRARVSAVGFRVDWRWIRSFAEGFAGFVPRKHIGGKSYRVTLES